MNSPLTRWLARTNRVTFTIFAGAVAFMTYFAMYGFRKPYTAALFAEPVVLLGRNFTLKSVLVIAQIVGYALSKFLGIKVLSEMPPGRRAVGLVGLVASSELALLLFGIVPGAWKALAIFLNGLPLGTIWGLVFSFLEGRRTSDVLGAILSASFILSTGVVKSVGRWVMEQGVSEGWMPFVVGLIFLPAIGLGAFLLAQLPPPSREEEALRTHRQPMYAADRSAFYRAFAPGLTAIVLMAMVLTGFRTIRDDFAAEIWTGLGFSGQEQITLFTLSESLVTPVVLVVLGLMVVIRDDRRAFLIQMSLMVGGVALIGLATLLHQIGAIGGLLWMVLIGVGLNVAYIPAGCFLFDRLIGATRFPGTAVFMIYVTDAFGYASSVGILLFRELFTPRLEWLTFFIRFAYAASLIGVIAFGFALAYFARRTRQPLTASPAEISEAQ